MYLATFTIGLVALVSALMLYGEKYDHEDAKIAASALAVVGVIIIASVVI